MPMPHQQKRNRALLCLALILLVLLSLTQLQNADNTLKGNNEFTNLSSKQINKIVIDNKNQPKMTFEKITNDWYLTEPFKRLADNSRIQVLLATLSLPKRNIYNSQEVDVESLGLAPAKARMRLNNTDFFFGNKENNNDRRYLQTGEKIALTADIIYPLFAQGVFGFVEKTLVPADLIRIASNSYTLEKTTTLWQSNNGSDAEAIASTWLGEFSQDVLTWPVTSLAALESAIKHPVELTMEKGQTLNMTIYEMPKLSLLHSENTDYALVITPDQFARLRITAK